MIEFALDCASRHYIKICAGANSSAIPISTKSIYFKRFEVLAVLPIMVYRNLTFQNHKLALHSREGGESRFLDFYFGGAYAQLKIALDIRSFCRENIQLRSASTGPLTGAKILWGEDGGFQWKMVLIWCKR